MQHDKIERVERKDGTAAETRELHRSHRRRVKSRDTFSQDPQKEQESNKGAKLTISAVFSHLE